METIITFLTEQNQWSIPIFIVSIIVDLISAHHVDKTVHEVRLHAILLTIIIMNFLMNIACLSKGVMFNMMPIFSVITIVLLCYSLVEIELKRIKNLKNK